MQQNHLQLNYNAFSFYTRNIINNWIICMNNSVINTFLGLYLFVCKYSRDLMYFTNMQMHPPPQEQENTKRAPFSSEHICCCHNYERALLRVHTCCFLRPSNVAIRFLIVFNKDPADKQDVSNKHRSHATEWSITLQAGFRALITLITNISDDDDEDDDVGGGCQGPVSQECVKNPFSCR